MRVALTIMGALIGTAMLAGAASASPLGSASGVASAAAVEDGAPAVLAQFRRGPRGPIRRGGRGWDPGAAAAVGIGAAVIGGIIAAESARREEEAARAANYCFRFRSYNPETGTYIAKGGRVVRCP